MFRAFSGRFCPVLPKTVWDDGLKDRFRKIFTEKCVIKPGSNVRKLTIAQFISTVYELDVLKRDRWPTVRIMEEMHLRTYAKDVLVKESYGAQPPPDLSLEDCLKWIAFFRVVSLNQ